MAAIKNSNQHGVVEWIGAVADREASLRSAKSTSVQLLFSGLEGEDHGGEIRASCVRVEELYPIGTPIRNTRQLTILSAEEIEWIANEIGLEKLNPALLGANMVVRGIREFTRIPPSTRLQFNGCATVTVDMENLPCNLPSREIEMSFPGHGKGFKRAARKRRGVTAWVEREGRVRVGDPVAVYVPVQSEWPAAEF